MALALTLGVILHPVQICRVNTFYYEYGTRSRFYVTSTAAGPCSLAFRDYPTAISVVMAMKNRSAKKIKPT